VSYVYTQAAVLCLHSLNYVTLQLRRYEKFRRSSFNRKKTKQFVQVCFEGSDSL
jgi:hypothetical protein